MKRRKAKSPKPEVVSVGGRPTKYNLAVADRIVEMVQHGNYLDTAAASAGIHRDTLHAWLRERADFSDRVAQAQAEAETRDVQLIAEAAKKQWPAAAWRLERKNPRRWGPRIQISVQEELDALLDHLETSLDQATYERVLTATASYDGRGEARALAQGESTKDIAGPGDDPSAP